MGIPKKQVSSKDITYLKLITEVQCEICESQIAEELKVENRSNYLTPFLFFKKIDPTNPNHFTVKKGLSALVGTWEVPLYPIKIDDLTEKIIHREMKKVFNEIIENKLSSDTKKILNVFSKKNIVCEKKMHNLLKKFYIQCVV